MIVIGFSQIGTNWFDCFSFSGIFCFQTQGILNGKSELLMGLCVYRENYNSENLGWEAHGRTSHGSSTWKIGFS